MNWRDFNAVFWKEIMVLWRAFGKWGTILGMGMYVIFFGVFPAFFLEASFVASPLTLFYMTLAPLVTGSGIAIVAFAGEREQHTLETLLATPLSDRAIFLGKLAANAAYAWLYTVLCLAGGYITASVMAGEVLAFSPLILAGSLSVGLLVALMSAGMGVLASLRAGTVKQAGRKLSLIYVVMMVPYILLNLMPEESRAALMAPSGGGEVGLIVLAAAVVLVLMNLGLVYAGERGFKRKALILD